MKKFDIEIAVGLFIVIGIIGMTYLSVKLGQIDMFKSDHYPIKAVFTTVSGLKVNTNVEIAGVKVGTVKNIALKDYNVVITLLIGKNIKIQDDAIASIRTKGIIGEKYVSIAPGASHIILKENDTLFDTESPLDIESLIKKFVMKE